MFKKFALSLLVAILATTTTVTLVSAQEQMSGKHFPDAHPHRRSIVGQVIEIGDSDFEVELPNGDTIEILVTDDTVFRSRQGEEGEDASFSDLDVGMWVAVYLLPRDGDPATARLVVLLPDDFDPSQLKGKRALGEVDKINPGQNTFQIVTRNGESLEFQADDNTRYAGGLESFEDLEKGLMVAVFAIEQENGTLLAKLVGSRNDERPQLEKTGGKISQIGDSSFTIELRQGGEKTFFVSEETRFGSREGNIEGLEDLEVGMPVVVVTKAGDNQALAVLVADPAILKLERIRGTVQSAGGSHLTIDVHGETMKFTVDEHTRIRGRGIEDLNDLKNGMRVLVLYIEKDGEYLAKGILAAPALDEQ